MWTIVLFVTEIILEKIFFVSSIVSYLVHLIIRNFDKGVDNNDAVKRFETYLFEEQIRNHPGQRMVIFFDMSDTGLRHLVSSILPTNCDIAFLSGLWFGEISHQ